MPSEAFIGEIIMFAGNYAPRDWALCDGQLLMIEDNMALFSILGTTYGGDGRDTFALPDLRGRVPVHEGTGPGLNRRLLGTKGGAETHTLGTGEIPSHSHPVSTNSGNEVSPQGNFPAVANDGESNYSSTSDTSSPPGGGGNQAHNNMQPYSVVNFIIAVEGLFPPRT